MLIFHRNFLRLVVLIKLSELWLNRRKVQFFENVFSHKIHSTGQDDVKKRLTDKRTFKMFNSIFRVNHWDSLLYILSNFHFFLCHHLNIDSKKMCSYTPVVSPSDKDHASHFLKTSLLFWKVDFPLLRILQRFYNYTEILALWNASFWLFVGSPINQPCTYCHRRIYLV